MKLSLKKSGLAAAVATTFVAVSGAAGAAGFALIEQSGSGMGNSFAGAAAVAEDASTVFFNPAGMSLLQGSQFAGAAHVIMLSAEFSGSANVVAGPTIPLSGGNGGDAGGVSVVPNIYLTTPVGDRLSLGLGVNAPFGLVTEYDAGWVGRYAGIKSDILTVNINPSASYKVTDAISIGGGINYQRLDAELTNALFTGGADGLTKLEADDDGWGWNLGAIIQVTPMTRVGVSYRSEIDYELEGNVTTTLGGAIFAPGTGPARADVTLPDMLSVSIAHSVSDRLQLLGDVTRTGWSSINQIRVTNPTAGTTWDVLVLDFDDTWRYSIGANYKMNDKWTLKAGLAYDETPVKGATTRTVRLPDNDRTWISVGGQMKVGQSGRLDLGYAHIFIDDADINQTKPLAGGAVTNVTGTYEGSVDIFSIQYTHSF